MSYFGNQFTTKSMKILRRYKITVSFISTAFVVVNLKILEVLRTNSASILDTFLRSLFTLTPLNIVQICWIFQKRHYFSWQKQIFKNLWKTWFFTGMGLTQSLYFWSNFDSLLPLKMVKIEESKNTLIKMYPSDYPNMSKPRSSSMKNRITFRIKI